MRGRRVSKNTLEVLHIHTYIHGHTDEQCGWPAQRLGLGFFLPFAFLSLPRLAFCFYPFFFSAIFPARQADIFFFFLSTFRHRALTAVDRTGWLVKKLLVVYIGGMYHVYRSVGFKLDLSWIGIFFSFYIMACMYVLYNQVSTLCPCALYSVHLQCTVSITIITFKQSVSFSFFIVTRGHPCAVSAYLRVVFCGDGTGERPTKATNTTDDA